MSSPILPFALESDDVTVASARLDATEKDLRAPTKQIDA
jgi:hypothetical protein